MGVTRPHWPARNKRDKIGKGRMGCSPCERKDRSPVPPLQSQLPENMCKLRAESKHTVSKWGKYLGLNDFSLWKPPLTNAIQNKNWLGTPPRPLTGLHFHYLYQFCRRLGICLKSASLH